MGIIASKWALAIAAIVVLGVVAAASAQQLPPFETKLPPEPVAEHIRAYVATVNAGDLAAIEHFRDQDITPGFAAEIPPVPFQMYFQGHHLATGGLELIGMRMKPGSATVAEVALRDRIYKSISGLEVTFDPAADQRISDFDQGPAPAWSIQSGSRLSGKAVAGQARALVDSGCRAKVFSGAMLVALDGKIVAEAACGEASRRYHINNNIETRINLGSMNKMFTAVAIMQLAEAGQLSLDDPLSKFLDETWLPRDVSSGITISQLLKHTSGLGSFLNGDFFKASRERYRQVDDYKPLVHDEKPSFAPGTKFQYSNTGFLLLGAVIEKVSGEKYPDYVRAHISRPAGMTGTDCYAMDEPVENLAMGYFYVPDSPAQWHENIFESLFQGGPAGGGFSTVGDLLRFATALQNGKLVSAASLKVLWTDHPPDNYGAGFEIEQTQAGQMVGHSGIFLGISSGLNIYPDKGYVVAVLSNIDDGAPPLLNAIGGAIARSAGR